MKLRRLGWLMILTGASVVPSATAGEKDTRYYEMRTYYAATGKLEALESRFRDHTTKLFEKHGMTNVGYWTPTPNPDNKLIYILSYPSKEAREKSWKAFSSDPDWQKAFKESESKGRLVTKVETVYMTATDYSPEIKAGKNGDRAFELRTYTASPGKLDDLHARFRDHTLKLFEKHGMTNVAYWTPAKDQKGADNTLIYILAHKNTDAAKKSWDEFRQDPDWIAAKEASEKKAGGSLTAKDGVKSVFMKATDYSPIR
jgi:hypothetical protein